jgi:FkbM family methyltransferase
MKGKSNESVSPWKIAIGFIAIALAAYGVYHFAFNNGGVDTPEGLKSGGICKQPYVKLLSLYESKANKVKIYSFSDDQISQSIISHDKHGTQTWSGAGPHTFYEESLCSTDQGGKKQCNGIVLDVGAFIGTHALILAKMGFHVHAFEPQLHAASLLQCSRAANHFKNLVVVPKGISNATSEGCIMEPMGSLAHQAMMMPQHLTKSICAPKLRVPLVSLDDYWTTELQSQPILFIKIDVEGYEDLVMAGGKNLFTKSPPPFVMIEYYPQLLALNGVKADVFLNRIIGYGYRVYDCMKKTEIQAQSGVLHLTHTYDATGQLADLLLIHKVTAAALVSLVAS